MLDPRLAHQSRARALTEAEQALARALEEIFSTGTHAFDAVAAALQARGLPRPSGAAEPWSATLLDEELRAINRSLDAAYQRDGVGV